MCPAEGIDLIVEVLDSAQSVALEFRARAVVVPGVSTGLKPVGVEFEDRRAVAGLCCEVLEECLGALVDPVALLVGIDRRPRQLIERWDAAFGRWRAAASISNFWSRVR